MLGAAMARSSWSRAAPGIGKTALLRELAARSGVDAVWVSADLPTTELVEMLEAADAVRRGGMLILEDLHDMDEPVPGSLRDLAALAATNPLLIVATYAGAAPAPALADAVTAVLRERAAHHLAVMGLTAEDTETLVRRITGRQPTDAQLRELWERSGGHPGIVTGLATVLANTGQLDGPLPESVRIVVARQLAHVGPECLRTLQKASVAGVDADLALLGDVLDEPDAVLRERLGSSELAGIVAVVKDAVRFQPPIMREVLYQELSGPERTVLHERIARHLARDGERSGDVSQLAHHLRLAIPAVDADWALKETLRAAELARTRTAFGEAASELREALRLLPLVDSPPRRADILLELADDLFRSGELQDAWAACREAADLGRASGDAATVADAALALRGIVNSTVAAEIHALCREALVMLVGADPVREGRVRFQLEATANTWAARDDPGQSGVLELSSGDHVTDFLALHAHLAASRDFGRLEERLALADAAVRLGAVHDRNEYVAWGRAWRLDGFYQLGRRVEMDAELIALSALADQMREPLWHWRVTLVRASLAILEGRFDEARQFSDDALAIRRGSRRAEPDFVTVIFRSALATFTGDGLEEIEIAVRKYVKDAPFFARTWHARVLALMGRVDEAAGLWAAAAPHLGDLRRNTQEWIVGIIADADLCVQLKDQRSAAVLYQELLPFAGLHAVPGAQTPPAGPVSLHLGQLALLLGDGESARLQLDASLALSRKLSAPPFVAQTHLELARLEMSSGRGTGGRSARDHLRAAKEIADRHGMTLLAAETSRMESARQVAPTELSQREYEVAGLIASGLSNRAIAERLYLSDRTVESHVAHILQKLGFNSRARIASWYTEAAR